MRFFILCLLIGLYAEENLPQIDRHRFDDVLLIVNYNHPHYASIPFIRELYNPLFPHIVFYGEKPHPDIIQADIYFGVYCIRVITDALTRFPNYRGYIFMQDDCMMNVWNYADLDLNKLWLAISRYPYEGGSCGLVPESWETDYDKGRGSEEFIHASLDGAYREHWGWWVPHVYGLQSVQKAMPYLDESSRGQLEKNVGKNVVIAQTCDLFYIPGKFRKKTVALSQIFRDVFYEISIPMIFSCLDSIENWELLKMYWGFPQEHFLDYGTQYHWIHPLKFSDRATREFVSGKLTNYYQTLK
ncbi:MAG: hypothetical protein WCF19_05470 [Chlamydiales bacterium]